MQNAQNRRVVPQTRPPTQHQRQKAPAASSTPTTTSTTKQLRTNRGMIKFYLLSIITLGIYAIVFYSILARDLNTVASPHDGKRTMPYWATLLIAIGVVIVVAIGTTIAFAIMGLEIGSLMYMVVIYLIALPIVIIMELAWFHRMSNRVGDELQRRYIQYSFDAGTFWIWFILGSFIIVGPFIYIFKLCKSMNFLCEDYNASAR